MKYSELKKLLRKNGCTLEREGSGHEIWFSPKTNKRFSVGRHNTEEVKKGTLQNILKDAGVQQ